MVQWIKILVAKFDDLNSIPRTCMTGENYYTLFSDLHAHAAAHTSPLPNINKYIYFKFR